MSEREMLEKQIGESQRAFDRYRKTLAVLAKRDDLSPKAQAQVREEALGRYREQIAAVQQAARDRLEAETRAYEAALAAAGPRRWAALRETLGDQVAAMVLLRRLEMASLAEVADLYGSADEWARAIIAGVLPGNLNNLAETPADALGAAQLLDAIAADDTAAAELEARGQEIRRASRQLEELDPIEYHRELGDRMGVDSLKAELRVEERDMPRGDEWGSITADINAVVWSDHPGPTP